MRQIGAVVAILFVASGATLAGEADGQSDPWTAFERQRATLRGPEGLTLALSTDKKEYYSGEPILVTTTYRVKGPAKVEVWAGTYDRSGRILDLHWTVVGPDGKPAEDPLAGYWLGGICGGLGNHATVSEGEPFSQAFYVNEWARFDLEGHYEIAAVSRRLSCAGSVASDRVKVRIRKPTETEIDAAIARYTKAMDEKKPKRDFKGGFDYHKASLFLRFLHHEKAVPHYLEYLNEREFSFQAACGLYGLPSKERAFEALSAKIAEEDYPISETARWFYQRLYRSVNPPAEDEKTGWPHGLTEEEREEIKAKLRRLAATKSPTARAISVFALTPANKSDVDYAIELAKSLKDMPEDLLGEAVHRVGLKKGAGIVPYLQGYLDHENERVRTNALAGLVRQGIERYVEMYLDDYVSEQPRFRSIYDHPKELTEERQLKLAALLDHPKRDVAERAANRLKKFAMTKKIVPYIREGLRRWTYPYGPKPRILEVWAKVDPEGAKRPLVSYMRSDEPTNRPHDIVGSLKHYLDDPNVVLLIMNVARSNRGQWHASQVLVEAGRPEVVPVLLERARAAPNALSCSSWRQDLEKVTGHIVPLTTEHNNSAKQAAVLDEWELWWNRYKGKPLIDGERSNIEHAIGLLEVETDGLWGRAHGFLTKATGKKFNRELYEDPVEGPIKDLKTTNVKKLRALWTDWWKANRETFRPAQRE